MDPEPLTCPYCNAVVPLPADAPAGRRVPCPRCGEAFTLRQLAPADSVDARAIPPTIAPRPDKRPSVYRGRDDRWDGLKDSFGRIPLWARIVVQILEPLLEAAFRGRTHRQVLAAVLGVMGLMAAVGLAFALHTTADRRANDTRMPPPPRKSPLTQPVEPAPETPAVSPAALEALHWLPPGVTVVAGVQVAEMRRTDAGRELLQRPFRVGGVEADPARLEGWTGLKMDEIDHIVLGARAEDDVPPPAVLVVRTVRPYNADAVKAALQAERLPDGGGKALYKVRPRGANLRPVLWLADDRTLAFALLANHLQDIPDRPAAGLERLAPETRDLLENRLESAGPVWAVGHSADWRRTGAALLLGGLPEKDAEFLGRVRDFAVQIQAERPPKLLASLRCDGDDAAQALEARLTAAKPNGPDWKTARDGPWVLLQARGDPMTFFGSGK